MRQITKFYLAGDIGGTKTVLALFSTETGPFRALDSEIFPSQGFESLEAIIRQYLSTRDMRIYGASFGVAGPVKGERAEATNLPWMIDARSLSSHINDAPVRLLNDLLATAHAVPYLTTADIHTVIHGDENPHSVLGVIAPGTGLGEAFLVWNSARYEAYPSEGGHANFGPATQVELQLLEYLLPRLDHVSYEGACSGKAIPNLYCFLRDVRKVEEPEWLRDSLSSAVDPTRIISKIDKKRFAASFTNKGRFRDLLSRIPGHVIVKPDIALFGAACHGFEQMGTN
jgi:glucokinase